MARIRRPIAYRVHVYVVVRLRVPRVDAFSPRDACGAAVDLLPDLHRLFDREEPITQEFAEEFSYFLVDEADDHEYRNSRIIPSVESNEVGLVRRLLAWYDAGQDADGLRSLIAEARETLSESV